MNKVWTKPKSVAAHQKIQKNLSPIQHFHPISIKHHLSAAGKSTQTTQNPFQAAKSKAACKYWYNIYRPLGEKPHLHLLHIFITYIDYWIQTIQQRTPDSSNMTSSACPYTHYILTGRLSRHAFLRSTTSIIVNIENISLKTLSATLHWQTFLPFTHICM